MRWALSGLLVAAAAASPSRATTPVRLALIDLDGRPADPLDTPRVPFTVFVFTRTDCPISNRYAPELKRLHGRFARAGVAFWLVYADPAEPVEAIRRHLEEYGYPFGALRDPQHSLVRMTRAKVTPEAAVFVAGPRLVYTGRIDDRYVSFGRTRAAPTTHDLERVLEALLAGEAVAPRTTPAIGCFIPPLQ
jgi:AhpC/TSA family protein